MTTDKKGTLAVTVESFSSVTTDGYNAAQVKDLQRLLNEALAVSANIKDGFDREQSLRITV